MSKKIPFFKQHDQMDCGPACLKMIARFYGKNYSIGHLRDLCYISRQGVSLLGISDAAEAIGLRTLGVKISFQTLATDAQLPVIVHWNDNHFIIVYKITSKSVLVCDPASGYLTYSIDEFIKGWMRAGHGIALLVEPTPEFFAQDEDEKSEKMKGFSLLYAYVKAYRSYFAQLVIALLFSSLLMLFFPLLTQSIVDIGINSRNLNFIHFVLMGQLALFFSRSIVDFHSGLDRCTLKYSYQCFTHFQLFD